MIPFILQKLNKTIASSLINTVRIDWVKVLLICFLINAFADSAKAQGVSIFYNNTAQPDGVFTVCGNVETNSLRILNGNASAISNTLMTLRFPTGGVYQIGSIVGATEVNISNLNAPIFSVPDLPASNSSDISYQVSYGCPVIAYQNTGGLTFEKADFSYTLGGTSKMQTGVIPPSTYNVVSASLSIINATNAAYTGNVGNSFNQTVTVRNGGLGCTTTGYLKLDYGGSNNVSFSSPSIGTLSNDTLFFNTVNMPSGDGKWCNGEDLIVTYTVTINNCTNLNRNLKAGWGCNGSNCQTSNNYPVGVTISNGVPNLSALVTYPMGQTLCNEPNFPVNIKVKNTGTGPATGVSVRVSHHIYPNGRDAIDTHDWLLAADWQYSNDGGLTWNMPTISDKQVRTRQYAVCATPNALAAMNLDMPLTYNLPLGDSLMIRGFIHDCALTDSNNCIINGSNAGGFSYRLNYNTQCGSVVSGGKPSLTNGGSPNAYYPGTAKYTLIEGPAQIAANSCPSH